MRLRKRPPRLSKEARAKRAEGQHRWWRKPEEPKSESPLQKRAREQRAQGMIGESPPEHVIPTEGGDLTVVGDPEEPLKPGPGTKASGLYGLTLDKFLEDVRAEPGQSVAEVTKLGDSEPSFVLGPGSIDGVVVPKGYEVTFLDGGSAIVEGEEGKVDLYQVRQTAGKDSHGEA
jgi:hypothetical protein